jgi:hypothetical protein
LLAIDDILQHAHDADLRRPMTTDLRPAIESLFDELERNAVDYVLVGGIALLSYVEGRNTQDVDLIVRSEDVGRMAWNATLRDRDFGQAHYRGIRVDLLLRSNPVFDDVATQERTTTTFRGRTIPLATRDGLLLLKLYALPDLYRHKHLARAALYEADIRMLHQGATVDDEALLRRLAPHLGASDVSELRRILEEQGQARRF